MVMLTDCPAMTIAVDLVRKATKQTNKNQILLMQLHSHQTMLIYWLAKTIEM